LINYFIVTIAVGCRLREVDVAIKLLTWIKTTRFKGSR